MKSWFAISVLLIAPISMAYASPGECALDFLKLPSGAYSAATGQANYAGIIGPEALFSNSSLIGADLAAFACHQELLLDTRLETMSAVIPLGRGYSAGAALMFFDPGKIEGYSADNNKTGNLASGDRLVKFAIANSGTISYGLSISLYHQRLAEEIGNGIGFGGGVAMDYSLGRLAVSCDNLGPKFKMAGAAAPLPQRLAVSTWMPLYHDMLDFNIDIMWSRDRGFGESIGLNYNLVGGFDIRAGYSENRLLSVGFGLKTGRASLDYSFIPQGLLGDRHILSFTFVK